eukprot:11237202-Heterocapsa_arctica.AAC.1
MRLKLKFGLSSSYVVQSDPHSAKETNGDSEDARRPFEKPLETFKTTLKTFKAIYTCMCIPVEPTE